MTQRVTMRLLVQNLDGSLLAAPAQVLSVQVRAALME
jgi:hypothetical protein